MTGSFSQHPVRVNSVGYVTDREKRATIVLPKDVAALPDKMVEVRDAAGSLVWTGMAEGPMADSSTNATVYIVDFTAFATAGSFNLAVPSLKAGDGSAATSATFRIGPDVFRDVLMRSMLGLYGQRCGSAVNIDLNSEHWTHAACHLGDASQKFLPSIMMDTIKPSLAGWHDAGDYGKYVTNGAFTVGMMLQAFERFQPTLSALELPIPEKGGALPDFLDEVKWELDWLLTTQGTDGSVSFKVTAQNFEGNVVPEKDGSRRFYTDISTAATGDFAAVFAQAARIYRPYDSALADSYLATARLSYDFLKASATIKPNLDMSVARKSAGFVPISPELVPQTLFTRRKFWAERFGVAPVLPTTRAEMDELGWDSCDVVLVTGDAYVDHPSFGMRLKWDLANFKLARPQIQSALEMLATRFQLAWELTYSDVRPRVAVFASRSPHCLYDLLLAHQLGELGGDLVAVVSNHDELRSVAGHFGVRYEHIPVAAGDKTQAEAATQRLLDELSVDLIVLARYMQFLVGVAA